MRVRCGCRPCLRQIRCTKLTLMPLCSAMASAVQCVVSPGGPLTMRATTAYSTSLPSGGMRVGGSCHAAVPHNPLGHEALLPAPDGCLGSVGEAHDPMAPSHPLPPTIPVRLEECSSNHRTAAKRFSPIRFITVNMGEPRSKHYVPTVSRRRPSRASVFPACFARSYQEMAIRAS